MMLLALVPPLWRRVVHARLDRFARARGPDGPPAGGAVTATLDGTVTSTSGTAIGITSRGTGAVQVTTNDAVSGNAANTGFRGIQVNQLGTGAVTVTNTSTVGGGRGIFINNNGTGANGVTLNVQGAVTGSAGSALRVENDASSGTLTGTTLVDVDAAVTGNGTEQAILVTNTADSAQNATVLIDAAVRNDGTGNGVEVSQSALSTGTLTVTTATDGMSPGGTITTTDGIALATTNLGTGLTDIDIGAAINSGGVGVSLTSGQGAVSFANTASIDAAGDAIVVDGSTSTAGDSSIDIDVNGNVTSSGGRGIFAENDDANTDIDIAASVNAAGDAVSVDALNGNVDINTAAGGDLTAAGGNTGILVDAENGKWEVLHNPGS